MAPQGNPRKVSTIVVNDDAETPTILNSATGQLLITNRVGQKIMELVDGSRDIDAIAGEITASFAGTDAEHVRDQTRQFLAKATEKGVLEWTGVSA